MYHGSFRLSEPAIMSTKLSIIYITSLGVYHKTTLSTIFGVEPTKCETAFGAEKFFVFGLDIFRVVLYNVIG